jgi:hypothetical protein
MCFASSQTEHSCSITLIETGKVRALELRTYDAPNICNHDPNYPKLSCALLKDRSTKSPPCAVVVFARTRFAGDTRNKARLHHIGHIDRAGLREHGRVVH